MTLLTIGDSFTYGEELENPHKDAWPAILSRRWELDLVNLGQPGAGNDYMLRTAVTEVDKIKPSVVIVAWTSCMRIELADEQGDFTIWPAREQKWQPSHRIPLLKHITRHHNDLYYYQRWLVNVVLLQNFFKFRNINYWFVNTFVNQDLTAQYNHISKEYLSTIDFTRFVGWPDQGMTEWQGNAPLAPRGHPLERGHQQIADNISNLIGLGYRFDGS